MSAPVCPKCNAAAQKTLTRYGVRYDCCGMWAWGNHPLADAATHEARKRAHEAFDMLWHGPNAKMGRGEAYRRLRAMLGLNEPDCHMKVMDRETALRVPAAAERIGRIS